MLIRTHSEAVLLLVICYFCYFATCYTSQDKVKTSCSLLGTVTLFSDFRAMATLTRVFVVMVRGIDDVFTPFCLLSNQLSG